LQCIAKGDIPADQLMSKYADENSKFLSINGMNAHYKDEGKGRVLLLLHGTGASLHTWDGWVKHLKQDFRVIRMDLPAFGLTGPNPDGDYTYEGYVRFLETFATRINIHRFVLVGNSLGGGIAWRYSIQHPDKIDRLILVDSAGYPGKHPPTFKLAKMPVLGNLLTIITPRFIIRKNLQEVYGDPEKVTDLLVDRYYEMLLRQGNRDAMRERIIQISQRPELIKKISVPTLIIWGEKDPWSPVLNAYRFKEEIKNSELIIYPGIGHVPMEEAPDKTVAGVLKFLS
jgi:pimeloyl-ACP methyl ester carboxylesterase